MCGKFSGWAQHLDWPTFSTEIKMICVARIFSMLTFNIHVHVYICIWLLYLLMWRSRHGVTWLNYWYIYLIKTPFVICWKCLFVAPEKSTENSLPQIIIIPQWLWLNKEIRTCNKCAEPITRLTLYYDNINVLFLFKNE